MKPSEIANAIQICRELDQTLMLWGPPGIGKSDVVAQAARNMGIQLVDFRVALRDPTDFKGFPMPDTKRNVMTFFRDEELPRDGEGILFMDEVNSGPQMVQSVAMQLMLYPHRIGNYQLPKGWSIVAAGNRETDRGVVNRMPTTVASRMTHADVEANVDDFINWVQDQLAAGNDVGSTELIAFLRFKESAFFTFDPKSANRTFGCPRTWVKADAIRKKLLPTDKSGRFRKDSLENAGLAYELVKGTVGEGEGSDYWSFLRLVTELPSIDEIKLAPDSAPIPEGMGGQIAITTTLASHTSSKDGSFARFMEYITRMDTEFQAVYIRDCLKRDAQIRHDKVFTKWALKNEKVVT